MKCRDDAEYEPGRNGKKGGKDQDPAIDPDPVESGNADARAEIGTCQAGTQRPHELDTSERQSNTGSAASDAKHHALDQYLTDQPRPICAQRAPYGDFTLARSAPCEHQI